MQHPPNVERVMVTGTSGFVGSWLIRAFQSLALERAVEVFPFTGGRGQGVGLDLTDADLVSRAVAEIRPTAVVHLAAVAAPVEARKDPRQTFAVNVMGTLNLAQAVLDEVPQARFVLAGSSEVYGRSFNDSRAPLNEDAPLRPATIYGVSKAGADMLIGQMAENGLKAFRFRPFNHTGPGQTPAYVIPAFARQIAEIEAGRQAPVIKVGNLDAERDFLDVRDVTRAYLAVSTEDRDIAAGTVINLASGSARSIRSILDMMLDQAKLPIAVEVDPSLVRGNDVPRACGDASRAAALLGWTTTISFEQTIADVLAFWRSRPPESQSGNDNQSDIVPGLRSHA